jgi:hypothetical protein
MTVAGSPHAYARHWPGQVHAVRELTDRGGAARLHRSKEEEGGNKKM